MSAYRRGLARAFDELVAAKRNVEVSQLDHVDHISIAGTHAPEIAEVMRRFVAD